MCLQNTSADMPWQMLNTTLFRLLIDVLWNDSLLFCINTFRSYVRWSVYINLFGEYIKNNADVLFLHLNKEIYLEVNMDKTKHWYENITKQKFAATLKCNFRCI